MPLVLDTHTLVWLIDGHPQLGNQARELIDTSMQNDQIAVSAISFWEITLLTRRGRLQLPQPIGDWRQRILNEGVAEIPVSGDIGIASVLLQDFHSDPADRIITATAIIHAAQLVTADTGILSWRGELLRQDASS